MFEYQKGLQDQLWEVLQDLKTYKRGAVLASTPGSGKTNMSIRLAERWLKTYPKDKVLVLTHGQTNLRSQYMGRIAKVRESQGLGKHFRELELDGKKDPNKTSSNVHVAIPQFFGRKFKKLPYALVIIDEVHHYYGPKGSGTDAGMVQDILKACPKTKRILGLSGTPFAFRYPEQEIFEGFGLVTKSAEELIEAGVLTDPQVELSTTTLPIREKDFRGAELVESFKFTQKDIDSALGQAVKNLLNPLSKKLKGARKAYPKTMIRCHSIAQATLVYNFFQRQGLKAFTSSVDSDPDSAHIQIFQDPRRWEKWGRPFLIVVDRGVLGFDDPELEAVIDLSCSKDVSGLFQLYCRVVRKSEENPKKPKQFIKVCPKGMLPVYQYLMSAVVHLGLKWFYEEYPGPKGLKPPRLENLMMEKGPKGKGYGGDDEPKRFKLPTVLEVKDIFRRVEQGDKNYATWGLTSLNDARRMAGEEFRDGDKSLEEAKALTLRLGRLPTIREHPVHHRRMHNWQQTCPSEYVFWLESSGIKTYHQTAETKRLRLEDYYKRFRTRPPRDNFLRRVEENAEKCHADWLRVVRQRYGVLSKYERADQATEILRRWVEKNARLPRSSPWGRVKPRTTTRAQEEERRLASLAYSTRQNAKKGSPAALLRWSKIEDLFKKYGV